MADALTLVGVGSMVLTEGIKFLYGQAGELLKRWRERRDAAAKGAAPPAPSPDPAPTQLPAIFAGRVVLANVNDDKLKALSKELGDFKRALEPYAEGDEPIAEGDQGLLEQADALRRVLEAVYGERITFQGEQRAPSGPLAEGEVDVKEVEGYAAAVRVRYLASGTAKGTLRADTVKQGGTAVAVDIDTMGTPDPSDRRS